MVSRRVVLIGQVVLLGTAGIRQIGIDTETTRSTEDILRIQDDIAIGIILGTIAGIHGVEAIARIHEITIVPAIVIVTEDIGGMG